MAFSYMYQAALFISLCSQIYSTNKTSLQQTTAVGFPNETIKSSAERENSTNNGESPDGSVLINAIMKEVEEIANKNVDTGENNSSVYDLSFCNTPASLDYYCLEIPTEVRTYFNNDMSVSGMLLSLFRTDIVEALQLKCDPGRWCLDDKYHKEMKQEKALFYLTSILCSENLWQCVQTMLIQRRQCKDKELNFLADTVFLLCDMDEVDVVGEECYARTKEALYVTYADLINLSGSKAPQLAQEGCPDFKIQMMETYLSAYNVCDSNQRILLQKFQSWTKLAVNSSQFALSCNISLPADYIHSGSMNLSTLPSSSGIFHDYTESYAKELEKFEEELEKELENTEEKEKLGEMYGNQGNNNSDDEINSNLNAAEEESTYMLIGIITLTTAMVMAIVGLVFLGYRKYGRPNCGKYRWGYSKLAEEDARLLRGEYD